MFTDFFTTFFKSFSTTTWIMLCLANVLSFVFSVLLTFAIAKDCDAKGIKNKGVWTVLTFFFSPLVPIIYACCRNSAKKNLSRTCLTCNTVVTEPMYDLCPNCNSYALQPILPPDAEKKEKQSKVLTILAVVCYVIGSVVGMVASAGMTEGMLNFADDIASQSGFDSYEDIIGSDFHYELHYGYPVNGEYVYYDMKGNAYDDAEDVLYYDAQGNAYEYEEDGDLNYYFEDSTGRIYDGYYCYVDANGYFYYDTNDELTYNENGNWAFSYVDSEGNVYFDAISASWDAEGNMVDEYGDYYFADQAGDLVTFE